MPRSREKSKIDCRSPLELMASVVVTPALSPPIAPHATLQLPLERAYYWEQTHPRQIFLTQPLNGRARNWNWSEAMAEARRMAAFLSRQEWPPESRIVILSKNCAWWILAELAIWMSGHVTVPIYTSVTNDAARRLFQHCQPVACFIGPIENTEITGEVPAGVARILFPNTLATDGWRWDDIVRRTAPLSGQPSRDSAALATIIYTSGTTGPPKGVMHAFLAFPYFAKAVEQVTGRAPRQRVVSYLPLAHIAERALTETAGLYMGWRIYFCENVATFVQDVKRARPTVFFSVPRLYAKFQAGILARISAQTLRTLLKIPVLGFLLRRAILRQLGLSRVRFAASGSAPIRPDLLVWFRDLGLRITEGYGTTESGITHTAPNGQCRVGRVGKNAPGVETRVALNGEIEVRSPMNMIAYYHDPVATAEVFTPDGFVRTGDLGHSDAEGWLKISGRIKEQFKTAKGKYVFPSAIETMLGVHEALESCIVLGSGLPAPIAVAVLSPQALAAAADPARQATLERSLVDLLRITNTQLAPDERLQFLVLTASKWSVQNGLITPTLKLRRTVVEEHFAPFINEWASYQKEILWDFRV